MTPFGSDYIAFRVGPLDCCCEAMSVVEIRGWTKATPVPHSADYVSGMINLRGTVLPVVDLALRLGFERAVPTARHAIIVAQIGADVVGLLVDEVADIVKLSDDTIRPTPQMTSEAARRFVKGVVVNEGRLISLLNLDALVPSTEVAA